MHCLVKDRKKQAGFTLLELLISLVILSFIALAAYQVLQVITQSRKVATSRSEELRAVIRAVNLLETDLRQIVMNPSPGESANMGASFSMRGNESEAALELVRQGWINPSARVRSKIVRVRWQLINGRLQRVYWDFYKTDNAIRPNQQDVLSGILNFKIAYLDSSGSWRDDWSLRTKENKKESSFKPPRALKIDLRHEFYGDIQRLVPLPETAGDSESETPDVEPAAGRIE